MQELLRTIEKTKSIADHISIILKYQQTGLLDRLRALEVYKSFNINHTEYNIVMHTNAVITNSLIQIDLATDAEIIDNLKKQIIWATSEEYLRNIGIKI